MFPPTDLSSQQQQQSFRSGGFQPAPLGMGSIGSSVSSSMKYGPPMQQHGAARGGAAFSTHPAAPPPSVPGHGSRGAQHQHQHQTAPYHATASAASAQQNAYGPGGSVAGGAGRLVTVAPSRSAVTTNNTQSKYQGNKSSSLHTSQYSSTSSRDHHQQRASRSRSRSPLHGSRGRASAKGGASYARGRSR
jgi:hypothetical protein